MSDDPHTSAAASLAEHLAGLGADGCAVSEHDGTLYVTAPRRCLDRASSISEWEGLRVEVMIG